MRIFRDHLVGTIMRYRRAGRATPRLFQRPRIVMLHTLATALIQQSPRRGTHQRILEPIVRLNSFSHDPLWLLPKKNLEANLSKSLQFMPATTRLRFQRAHTHTQRSHYPHQWRLTKTRATCNHRHLEVPTVVTNTHPTREYNRKVERLRIG